MSNYHITQTFSIEFLGVARSGKSTTSRALLEALEEKGFEYADFTEFQQTEKREKYKLLLLTLCTKANYGDIRFFATYFTFFVRTLLWPKRKLDRTRILHPLKYYLITKHLMSTHRMTVVEDGATHICSGYHEVDKNLHKAVLGSKAVLLIINDISVSIAMHRVDSDEPSNVPWIVRNKKELRSMYEHHLNNQNILLNTLQEHRNINILHINASDSIEFKVRKILDFISDYYNQT